MRNDDRFVSVPSLEGEGAHRREASRIRGLAANATTPAMRKHLEDRARAHEWLAATAGKPAEVAH